MKKKCFFLFIFIFFSVFSQKFVIGDRPAGLFSLFISVLNYLSYCEKMNQNLSEDKKLIPVVHWGRKNYYYHPKGFCGAYDNVWEYYFEQVSHLGYEQGDRIYSGNTAPDRSGINFGLQYRMASKNRKLRFEMFEIIAKYIRLKKPISRIVEDFYSKNIAGKLTVGIHLRGLDKYKERRYVPLQKIITYANRFVPCQFFIATDDANLLDQAKKLLNGPVIYSESFRSKGRTGIHLGRYDYKPQLGAEVIIDAYLLSRCDTFIHTGSNVAAAVLFLNPELEAMLF